MTNEQAIGYMLLACKDVGLRKDTIRQIYRAMYYQFDMKTEEEAEEKGHDWYFAYDELSEDEQLFLNEMNRKFMEKKGER